MAALERVRTPACVGLDPVLERLPQGLRPRTTEPAAAAEAIGEFSRHILLAMTPFIGCVKVQSACFERFGHWGVSALEGLIRDAKELRLEVILDAKRGDIGVSAEHYAAAAFDRPVGAAPDWITVNGYFGEDGIRPFLRPGHGAFVLVRTSNPGGVRVQGQPLAAGGVVADAVASMVAEIGADSIGARGFSSVGAVVGATDRPAAARLREAMPDQVFLVPGFGAQGGGIDDVTPCFRPDGTGAVVTASRSVIYASGGRDADWARRVSDAAASFADEIGRAAGWR
jgi:orotidine-5'-phosphate decarboxylase